jgi:hypothetical protein
MLAEAINDVFANYGPSHPSQSLLSGPGVAE